MNSQSVLAFAAAIFILGITPGPAVFAAVSRSLAWGFPVALVFSAGVVTGDLIFMTLAVFGLAVIASKFALLFAVIRWLSGGYLVYLGFQAWTAPVETSFPSAGVPQESKKIKNYLNGLFLTLGNPKTVLFYFGFMPTFFDLSRVTVFGYGVMVLVLAVTLWIVMILYTYPAAKARRFFQSPTPLRWLNRGAGAAMAGAGIAVLVRGS